MDAATLRDAARRVAEDFEWLEAHCRTNPEEARHAGELRLAAALTRNVIAPALNGVQPPPLLLAVVGGAGTGKSTVANFLAGVAIAETNPQAGYTRHPIAFLNSSSSWPAHLGFIGPLRRLDHEAASNLDEDVYQVRRLPPGASSALADFVLWDCPDMTTWASAGYASRLLEVAALADVIVYVASDERYNDEVPTQFLQLLLRAGKTVVVVLTKMSVSNAESIATHFRSAVLNRIAEPTVGAAIPIITLPQMTPAEQADPGGAGSKWRTPLINQVLAQCPSPRTVRERTIANAATFLKAAAESLLIVAKRDLQELDGWTRAVLTGKADYELRYRNEYLAGEPFQRFERTRKELLATLDLPASGRAASGILQKIRWPVEWLMSQLAKLMARPETPNMPEPDVLKGAMIGWLDLLQAESLRKAGLHPMWKSLSTAFDSGLKDEAQRQFNDALTRFQSRESDLDAATAKLKVQVDQASPRLTMLRYGKFALDICAILGTIIAKFYFEWSFWNLIWLIPLAAYLSHMVAVLSVRWLVNRERSKARQSREAILVETVTNPLSAWLIDRPVSGGSPAERLKAILQRTPTAIDMLQAALAKPVAS